jgi:hypothetical protein
VVSNRPAALYYPLPYGRRTTPSKKDGGTLEGMAHDYSTPARDGAVTSDQWERSPSLPSALCDHPGRCTIIPDAVRVCGDGTPPRQPMCLVRPHVNGTLESPRGRPSNEQPLHHPPSKPLLDAHRIRHDAPPEARFARTTVYFMALYAMPLHVGEIVWHTCKLLPPWPIKGGAVP